MSFLKKPSNSSPKRSLSRRPARGPFQSSKLFVPSTVPQSPRLASRSGPLKFLPLVQPRRLCSRKATMPLSSRKVSTAGSLGRLFFVHRSSDITEAPIPSPSPTLLQTQLVQQLGPGMSSTFAMFLCQTSSNPLEFPNTNRRSPFDNLLLVGHNALTGGVDSYSLHRGTTPVSGLPFRSTLTWKLLPILVTRDWAPTLCPVPEVLKAAERSTSSITLENVRTKGLLKGLNVMRRKLGLPHTTFYSHAPVGSNDRSAPFSVRGSYRSTRHSPQFVLRAGSSVTRLSRLDDARHGFSSYTLRTKPSPLVRALSRTSNTSLLVSNARRAPSRTQGSPRPASRRYRRYSGYVSYYIRRASRLSKTLTSHRLSSPTSAFASPRNRIRLAISSDTLFRLSAPRSLRIVSRRRSPRYYPKLAPFNAPRQPAYASLVSVHLDSAIRSFNSVKQLTFIKSDRSHGSSSSSLTPSLSAAPATLQASNFIWSPITSLKAWVSVAESSTVFKYLFCGPQPSSSKLSTNLLVDSIQHELHTLGSTVASSSNLWTVRSSNYTLRRKLLRRVTNSSFRAPVTLWYYRTLVRFIENCSGRRVALRFGPFVENALTFEDRAKCRMWSDRVVSFQKILGHRIFTDEALRLVALSFRLKDPSFLANWIRGMLKRMSFWKIRLLFRYIKFLVRYIFKPSFSHFGFKGFKLRLKGKISVAGNARSRALFIRVGNTSHATMSNKVAYDLSYVNTFTGVLGFKLWFFY